MMSVIFRIDSASLFDCWVIFPRICSVCDEIVCTSSVLTCFMIASVAIAEREPMIAVAIWDHLFCLLCLLLDIGRFSGRRRWTLFFDSLTICDICCKLFLQCRICRVLSIAGGNWHINALSFLFGTKCI